MNTMKRLFTVLIILVVSYSAKSQVLDAPMKIVDRAWEKNESGEGHVSNREAIPYSHLREADVQWSRRIWRQIDLREKMNLPLYYPEYPEHEKISLTQLIWKGVMTEGTIRAFEEDYCRTPITNEMIEEATTSRKIVTVPSRANPDIDSTFEVVENFQSKDVKKIMMKEDWFFDREESKMDVRIISMCAFKDKYAVNEATGEKEYVGMIPLFWIYFPEARLTFAKYEVYNRHNDAERRSFDDLFHKRFFASYITKEENVYSREIQGYETGINALLEADQIKEEIFNYEQDLWEY